MNLTKQRRKTMALPILVSKDLHADIVARKKELNQANKGLRTTINDLCSNWVIKGIKKNRFKLDLVVKVKDKEYGTIIVSEAAALLLTPAIEKAIRKYKLNHLSICDYVSVLCRIGLDEGTKIKTKILA